jgi:hypothetical protein
VEGELLFWSGRTVWDQVKPVPSNGRILGRVNPGGFVAMNSWYSCPNGHRYSIGNCTRPWEERPCPVAGCNAIIGGTNHELQAGNRR